MDAIMLKPTTAFFFSLLFSLSTVFTASKSVHQFPKKAISSLNEEFDFLKCLKEFLVHYYWETCECIQCYELNLSLGKSNSGSIYYVILFCCFVIFFNVVPFQDVGYPVSPKIPFLYLRIVRRVNWFPIALNLGKMVKRFSRHFSVFYS